MSKRKSSQTDIGSFFAKDSKHKVGAWLAYFAVRSMRAKREACEVRTLFPPNSVSFLAPPLSILWRRP